MAYLEKISPVYGGKKYQIPLPDFCPSCRLQRRMCFRNERSLYHRKCDATGKNIISCYAPDSGYIVYEHDFWWGDGWDGLSYAKDFDFNRNLHEQLKELSFAVPHSNLITSNCINCDYANYLLNSRNCYLVFGGSHNENVMYSKFMVNCRDTMDGLSLNACEFCYEGNSSESCYSCRFFHQCRNCSDCLMIEECLGCRNCIACFGLRNQEYCYLNKRVSKEDFEKLAIQYKSLTHKDIGDLRGKLDELKKDLPHVQSHIYLSENCTGDNILSCKNCEYAFDVRGCEDCKYINFTPFANNCRDGIFSAPGPTEFCYQTCSIVGHNNSMSLFLVWNGGANMFYCLECHSCRDCFGCIGLKNKQYCILNKQYSKEEYEKFVGRIIEKMTETFEWGQFFDPQLSSFGHNEAVGHEYFPINRDEALKDGFRWKDEEKKEFKAATYRVPESIDSVPDSVTGEVLVCDGCGKNYRIIPEELKFYRLNRVPLPLHCYDCRHMSRIAYRSNFNLHKRPCDKCGKDMWTTYSPERSEKVYCDECYLKAVY